MGEAILVSPARRCRLVFGTEMRTLPTSGFAARESSSVTGKGAELSGFVINGRPSKKHDGYGYHRYGYGKYGYGSKYGYGKSSGSKV